MRSAVGLLALCAALIALRGIALLYDHSLHSIDGAMQTWFALSHFADGEQLGVAFQSYLGVTMILALLPIFWALGETLYASTFAAYTAVFLAAFGTAYAIAWMIRCVLPWARWIVAIGLLFVFYFIGPGISELIGLRYPLAFDPGVSLRPVRGALSFLVLPVFAVALRSIMGGGSFRAPLLLGLVAGMGLLWSNDAGIALVIALVIALGLALLRRPSLLARTLALFIIGAGISAAGTILIVTHGEPTGWLRYNFVDVAGDQFWYFAPWDRATRILGPVDLVKIITGGDPVTTISLLLLLVCIAVATFKLVRGHGSPVRLAAFTMIGASTIGTALIPQIGGHIDGAYNNITFMLGLAAPLVVFPRRTFKIARPMVRFAGQRGMVAATGCAALAMIAIEGARTVTVINDTDRTFYSRSLGFHVTPKVGKDLAAMEQLAQHWDEEGVPQDRRILSVYTSVLDIAAGTQSPEPVGSLIHALGPENRARFTAQVSNLSVSAVVTIAPDYSGWAGWNLRANWPFFKALRDIYYPAARTDQQILWFAGGGKFAKSDAICEVLHLTDNRTVVTITSETSGLASIRLNRRHFAEGRTAMLTITEDSPFARSAAEPAWSDFPRYGVANAQVVEVSAPVEAGLPTRLTLEILDGSDIGSAQCSAQVYEPIDFAALPDLSEAVDTVLREVRR